MASANPPSAHIFPKFPPLPDIWAPTILFATRNDRSLVVRATLVRARARFAKKIYCNVEKHLARQAIELADEPA